MRRRMFAGPVAFLGAGLLIAGCGGINDGLEQAAAMADTGLGSESACRAGIVRNLGYNNAALPPAATADQVRAAMKQEPADCVKYTGSALDPLLLAAGREYGASASSTRSAPVATGAGGADLERCRAGLNAMLARWAKQSSPNYRESAPECEGIDPLTEQRLRTQLADENIRDARAKMEASQSQQRAAGAAAPAEPSKARLAACRLAKLHYAVRREFNEVPMIPPNGISECAGLDYRTERAMAPSVFREYDKCVRAIYRLADPSRSWRRASVLPVGKRPRSAATSPATTSAGCTRGRSRGSFRPRGSDLVVA